MNYEELVKSRKNIGDMTKEECPLNFGYTEKCDEEKAQDVFYKNDYCEENCNDDYKKCWLKYFERLQELKEAINSGKYNNKYRRSNTNNK